MQGAEIIFLDTFNNRCNITGAVCDNGDCRSCSIPIVMSAKARELLEEM